MEISKKFVILMIILSILASVCYLFDKNYTKSLYWFAAAVINISVLVM